MHRQGQNIGALRALHGRSHASEPEIKQHKNKKQNTPQTSDGIRSAAPPLAQKSSLTATVSFAAAVPARAALQTVCRWCRDGHDPRYSRLLLRMPGRWTCQEADEHVLAFILAEGGAQASMRGTHPDQRAAKPSRTA